MSETKYVDITMIVDDGETVTTIKIPRAVDVSVKKRPEPEPPWSALSTYIATSFKFDISLEALLDPVVGQIYSIQRVVKEPKL